MVWSAFILACEIDATIAVIRKVANGKLMQCVRQRAGFNKRAVTAVDETEIGAHR